MISQQLLAILACPKCKAPVELTKDNNGLTCESCKLLYEIRDDIPIMLVDQARIVADSLPRTTQPPE